jgi:Na+-translocating ferredoxin:NAD+ oxidoreductase RnfC subunit
MERLMKSTKMDSNNQTHETNKNNSFIDKKFQEILDIINKKGIVDAKYIAMISENDKKS